MKFRNHLLFAMLLIFSSLALAQTPKKLTGPSSTGFIGKPKIVPSIAEQRRNGTLILADKTAKKGAPKKRNKPNAIVPGKGSIGPDLAVQKNLPTRGGSAPNLVFEADLNSVGIPSDPTGAIGPNHYLTAWNSAFRIFDRDGNPLTAEISLAALFSGNTLGDPIVLYDEFADRFIVTEFDQSPNGFNVAVSRGPDPVNDGWYIYTTGFETGAFPDYPKFSIWSDGYYVTANIFSNRRVFALERDKMLLGDDARFVGFTLPGILTNGFYSPQGFHVTGGSHPERGNFNVVYLQDDAWGGVSNDHLDIWTLNVDWENPASSTSSSPQSIDVTDFISVFDNGDFANLRQPNGVSIDALQATVMNQAQYRQFDTYNSVVFNFVVDTDPGLGNANELAGIRWYELRQTAEGEPWSVYQEGTYTAPGGRHAFQGSMGMDIHGNIGMAYGSLSNSERLSIRYTGRLNGDTPGDMTFSETLIAQGSGNSPVDRVADYVHLSVDPRDDRTFWHIAEYFNPNRRDVVGVFNLGNALPSIDAAIVEILPDNLPNADAVLLSDSEEITITIENYGTTTLTNVPVTYTIDGGVNVVSETYTGSIAPGQTDTYTFSETADLSGSQFYRIEAGVDVSGDEFTENDYYAENIFNEGILSSQDLEFSNSELVVSSQDNKKFEIELRTNFANSLVLQVYDNAGREILYNNLFNEGNKFSYSLDMSYMASGVYLVTLGNSTEVQKTNKIIVK